MFSRNKAACLYKAVDMIVYLFCILHNSFLLNICNVLQVCRLAND